MKNTKRHNNKANGERLLLVDDEESIRFIYPRIFKSMGFKVEVAEGLFDAEKMMNSVDLVVTDLKLKNGQGKLDQEQGIIICKRARKHGIPVILLSGFTTKMDRAEDYHADMLLSKPVIRRKLNERILSKSFMKKVKARKNTRAKITHTKPFSLDTTMHHQHPF